jgi:hypothetical protein
MVFPPDRVMYFGRNTDVTHYLLCYISTDRTVFRVSLGAEKKKLEKSSFTKWREAPKLVVSEHDVTQ